MNTNDRQKNHFNVQAVTAIFKTIENVVKVLTILQAGKGIFVVNVQKVFLKIIRKNILLEQDVKVAVNSKIVWVETDNPFLMSGKM